ncbi:MAG: T9SS type A sorting domain-containing protein [Chitinispirillaceae bacterium]|nr:T9SS type A sorting domain-containing protein [Chitinispirillaceae bacterium]
MALMQPPKAKTAKPSPRALFRFIGRNRIRISRQGTARVELFSMNGRLAWSGKGEGPCMLAAGRSLKNGMYYVRMSGDGGKTVVAAICGVNDQR